MPRAYYKPFTIYEEAVGFKTIQGITKGVMALLFGGLVLKMYLFANYSACTGHNETPPMTYEQMEQYTDRMTLVNKISSREEIRKSIVRQQQQRLPPA